MNYEEWLAGVPATITNDPLWRNEVPFIVTDASKKTLLCTTLNP